MNELLTKKIQIFKASLRKVCYFKVSVHTTNKFRIQIRKFKNLTKTLIKNFND